MKDANHKRKPNGKRQAERYACEDNIRVDKTEIIYEDWNNLAQEGLGGGF
jgi:hypothetical protein